MQAWILSLTSKSVHCILYSHDTFTSELTCVSIAFGSTLAKSKVKLSWKTTKHLYIFYHAVVLALHFILLTLDIKCRSFLKKEYFVSVLFTDIYKILGPLNFTRSTLVCMESKKYVRLHFKSRLLNFIDIMFTLLLNKKSKRKLNLIFH